ncbi:hypothetical protein J7L67_06310 [bacterium]|nr:hypothetical protein [bacterium]
MNLIKNICLITVLSFGLAGCGYQLGLAGKDASIQNIYCYTVKNETRIPGMEMPATNSIINTLNRRGANLKVVSDQNKADTFLYVKLLDYERSAARFDEADITQQSVVTLYASMKLYHSPIDIQSNKKDEDTTDADPFFEIEISATCTYFLEPNQPEGERSIRPQLYDKLSDEIVDQIVNRWGSSTISETD